MVRRSHSFPTFLLLTCHASETQSPGHRTTSMTLTSMGKWGVDSQLDLFLLLFHSPFSIQNTWLPVCPLLLTVWPWGCHSTSLDVSSLMCGWVQGTNLRTANTLPTCARPPRSCEEQTSVMNDSTASYIVINWLAQKRASIYHPCVKWCVRPVKAVCLKCQKAE